MQALVRYFDARRIINSIIVQQERKKMQIMLADVQSTLTKLMEVESEFEKRTKKIAEWIEEHQKETEKNLALVKEQSERSDIQILIIFLRDLLVKFIKGEAGGKVYRELQKLIKSKADLHKDNYIDVLKRSQYRWGIETGMQVIEDVVHYFSKRLQWNWDAYIAEADRKRNDNYQDDEILNIKNIKFKLRDLALSNFSPYYAAFDLHVSRVITRIGWLNYGFDLLGNSSIEMGNNQSEVKNYLFFHKLFFKLSSLTNGKFTPVDLDRTFWHLGKSICKATPKCKACPINNVCLTGKYRIINSA